MGRFGRMGHNRRNILLIANRAGSIMGDVDEGGMASLGVVLMPEGSIDMSEILEKSGGDLLGASASSSSDFSSTRRDSVPRQTKVP